MSGEFILQNTPQFPVALWINNPIQAYQGCRSDTPFEVFLYSEDNNPHVVSLYAQGSKSIPYQNPQNKWSHLNPQWKFTDVNGKVINEIVLTNGVSTTYNGTTGYIASAQFYYIDDMPAYGNSTVIIWAVADFLKYPVQNDIQNSYENVPGYANSKIITVAPFNILELIPRYLSITRDGLNPLFDYYWISGTIPHVVSVVGTTTDYSLSAVMKNVPATNADGILSGPIHRSIPGISGSELLWTPVSSNFYLSAFDNNNFIVGGYLKGNVLSNVAANNVNISAYLNLISNGSLYTYPYLWVSNPENNTLNKIYAPYINEEWLIEGAPLNLDQTVINTDYLQVTAAVTNMSLTGFHGIYGISLDGLKNVWATDAESDKVYKFNSNGVLLSTFNFGENNPYGWVSGGCTPAGVSINQFGDAWITFFDSTSTICISATNGNIVKTINPGNFSSIYQDPTFKPVLAETDNYNNLWVSYNNTVCSVLIKYNTSSNLPTIITSISLPSCSNPMDIHITKDNGLWVSLTYNSGPTIVGGELRKYDSSYNLICSIAAINPTYIAIDSKESLWFTQQNNTLTKITTSSVVSSWSVGTTAINSQQALEGLCCDAFDNIYIVNSVDNTLYTLRKNIIVPCVNIIPDLNLSWYNDLGYIYSLTFEENKSAQALGDWSGNRWQRKYGSSGFTTAGLTGISNKFNIYDFKGYDIRRYNESWDASNEIKNTITQPHIFDNTILWDKYMAAVWGTEASPQGKGYGREAYEKIANFAQNHVDVNTCNIAQLYSLAEYTDVPIDTYSSQYPAELRRILDIASINQQTLWGSRCKCNRNINHTYTEYVSTNIKIAQEYNCEICGHTHQGNRGEIFNPYTYMVTANVPFIIEDRSRTKNKYQLITPPASCFYIYPANLTVDACTQVTITSGCLYTYPLSSFYNIILPPVRSDLSYWSLSGFDEVTSYFCFFHHVNKNCREQIGGVINWNDPYTTLNENSSSIISWYGEGETLERMISYILYKGLGLIDE